MMHASRSLHFAPRPLSPRTLASLGLVLGALLLAATPALGAEEALDTRVTMLVGSPGAEEGAASVLVVPGTVLPISGPPPSAEKAADDSASRVQLVRDLADKLQRAVGLAKMEVGYSQDQMLEVGKAARLAGPRASSSISGKLTLLGFNKKLATYRVELQQGGVTLADSKVAVERGGRAVVGGLDGDEAPYFFLVLQPAAHAIRVTDDVQPPQKINAVAPQYTEEARKDKVQGVVILQAVITEEGLVEDVEVLKGLPHGLTEAAVEALRQWTFEPATLNGKPVAVYYNLTFNFRLDHKKKEEGEKQP